MTTTETVNKTKWTVDPSHTEIGFKVKHMMITNVSGSFSKFDITTETEDNDFSSARISFSADVASISTANPGRDTHLKSPDFFDTEKYPRLNFVSTKMQKLDDENYLLLGNLTIKGITRPVTLEVEFGGIGTDPYRNEKAGFTLKGKINRTDFNLNWNAALETGGVLVSEEVRLFAEVQLVKQA